MDGKLHLVLSNLMIVKKAITNASHPLMQKATLFFTNKLMVYLDAFCARCITVLKIIFSSSKPTNGSGFTPLLERQITRNPFNQPFQININKIAELIGRNQWKGLK